MDTTSVDLLSLTGADVRLKKVAATRGGEWAGPCPFCGGAEKQGSDRFRVWPAEGRFWCRRCNRNGDAIAYVRQRHGVNFFDALDRLGLRDEFPHKATESTENTKNTSREGAAPQPVARRAGPRRPAATGSTGLPGLPALPLPRYDPLEPPSDAWQGRAIDFCSECTDRLWDPAGAKARAWLRDSRGLSEQTIMNASLGYNAEDRREAPDLWGFGDDHKPVWLPRGITIPWAAGGHAWRVSIRRPEKDPKYVAAAGSANALYRVDTLAPGFGVVLVEGEFDALTIWQHAGGIISSVATGSTSGARRPHWLTRLASCGVVLAAFDDDEAGEEAAAYWLDVLPNARRWRPYYGKDANGLATSGGDVAAWILDGLGSAPW